MIEKSSSVVLTDDEIEQIKSGKIPMRIGSTWGFTLPELQSILAAGTYSKTSWTRPESGTENFNL